MKESDGLVDVDGTMELVGEALLVGAEEADGNTDTLGAELGADVLGVIEDDGVIDLVGIVETLGCMEIEGNCEIVGCIDKEGFTE